MGDFNLTVQLLACAVKNNNVEPRRVFSTGCSAGGLFAGAMGAARSSYVAAVAPNSGGWALPVGFQNKHTPALMTVHGAPGVDVLAIDFSDSSKSADTVTRRPAHRSSSTATTEAVTAVAPDWRGTSGSSSRPIRSARIRHRGRAPCRRALTANARSSE